VRGQGPALHLVAQTLSFPKPAAPCVEVVAAVNWRSMWPSVLPREKRPPPRNSLSVDAAYFFA